MIFKEHMFQNEINSLSFHFFMQERHRLVFFFHFSKNTAVTSRDNLCLIQRLDHYLNIHTKEEE